jgi:hypothetical protein
VRVFFVFGIKRYHFAPVGKKLLGRPKLFSHVRLRRTDEPELGGGAGCAVAILDESDVVTGQVSVSNSDHGLPS